jgi:sugar phosphate isomerase/epimerase
MYASSRLSRRFAAVMAIAAAVTVLLTAFAGGAQAHNGKGDRHGSIGQDQISIQLFNFLVPIIGGFPPPSPPLSTEQQQANIRATFATLHRIGYRQFENFGGTWGWTDAEYRKVFRSYKLQAVGDHGSLDPATFDARLDQAKTLGLKYVGSGGWPPPGNMNTLENALAVAKNLNELGKKAGARGLNVYGHNHDAEFRTKLPYDVNGDGVTELVPAIEVVMLNTDPRYVTFEIDVHWAYEGLGHEHFGDLVYFLWKYRNRISMLHVKGTAANGAITDVGTPSDITDWKSVFRAAGKVDIYHFEYDLAPDPVASAENGYRFLSRIRF